MLVWVKRPHNFKYGTGLSAVFTKWHWSIWYQIVSVPWLSSKKNSHITLCLAMTARPIVWFQKISIPPPPPRKPIGNSEGEGGSMGNYFPRGDRPCTKHWKQRTIDLKHKNTPTYVVLKKKVGTPGHWHEVNTISFNVSVFLWVTWRYNRQKNDVSLERSRKRLKWRT